MEYIEYRRLDDLRKAAGGSDKGLATGKIGEYAWEFISRPPVLLSFIVPSFFTGLGVVANRQTAIIRQDVRDDKGMRSADVDMVEETKQFECADIVHQPPTTIGSGTAELGNSTLQRHEIKTDAVSFKYGNIVLETYNINNRNDDHNGRGWWYYTEADWLHFCLLPDDRFITRLSDGEIEAWDNSQPGKDGHAILAQLPLMAIISIKTDELRDLVRRINPPEFPITRNKRDPEHPLALGFLVKASMVLEEPSATLSLLPIIHTANNMAEEYINKPLYAAVKDEWVSEENRGLWYTAYGFSRHLFSGEAMKAREWFVFNHDKNLPRFITGDKSGLSRQMVKDMDSFANMLTISQLLQLYPE